jgi:hypothetical protein
MLPRLDHDTKVGIVLDVDQLLEHFFVNGLYSHTLKLCKTEDGKFWPFVCLYGNGDGVLLVRPHMTYILPKQIKILPIDVLELPPRTLGYCASGQKDLYLL